MTLAITTYNRTDLLLESYAQVLNDPRISEIVIVDDCSEPEMFEQLVKKIRLQPFKVKLYRNEKNLGMLENKRRAIELSTSEWVIIFDSDNVIDGYYLNSIPKELHSDTIYCPSLAGEFDYRPFEGNRFDKSNFAKNLKDKMFRCLANTCNYLVNRKAYLEAWEPNPETKGSDTIWFNYTWLRKGGSFYVVPGMHYFHRRHDGSGWLQDHAHNTVQAEKTIQLIKKL